MFDVIERLKSEWTDKYVVINSSAPELARFAHATGTVKTVNMNGRCLVEFDQFNNTGWYDIDPAALKIVTEPLPKPAEKEAAKPAAATKPAAAAKPAAAKPAAKASGAGKPSTADILAAARAKAGGGAAPAAAKPAAADKKPAAPSPAASAPAGGKLSTAEILARARAAKAGAAAATPAAETEEESEPTIAEVAAPEVAAPKATAKKPASAGGSLPTTTADKIAWCRQHDAKA
jgi:hypothetical protein